MMAELLEVEELRWVSGPEGGAAGGKVMLLRGKRPGGGRGMAFRGGGAPAAWSPRR